MSPTPPDWAAFDDASPAMTLAQTETPFEPTSFAATAPPGIVRSNPLPPEPAAEKLVPPPAPVEPDAGSNGEVSDVVDVADGENGSAHPTAAEHPRPNGKGGDPLPGFANFPDATNKTDIRWR